MMLTGDQWAIFYSHEDVLQISKILDSEISKIVELFSLYCALMILRTYVTRDLTGYLIKIFFSSEETSKLSLINLRTNFTLTK